ncbi:unnamed protein product [Knipowitschia caucasica]
MKEISALAVVGLKSSCVMSPLALPASNLHITSSEEPAEGGKPSPSEQPPDSLLPPEAVSEARSVSAEPVEKERGAKKTKNNKGAKPEVLQGPAAAAESVPSPPADGLDVPGPLLFNKRNSFREYTKLPTNLPMRSTSCVVL